MSYYFEVLHFVVDERYYRPPESDYLLKKPHQNPLGSLKGIIILRGKGKRFSFILCYD
jgi:hypothetical protein